VPRVAKASVRAAVCDAVDAVNAGVRLSDEPMCCDVNTSIDLPRYVIALDFVNHSLRLLLSIITCLIALASVNY
jgi:hypothetical protein